MKKFLLAIASAALCLSASAETATFDFTADNPYNWNTLPKDASFYIDDSAKPLKLTEGHVSLMLDGKFRRLEQKAFGGKTCLLIYNGTTLSFSCPEGYKMSSIDFYSGKAKTVGLYVESGEMILYDEVETGETYNHSENGTPLAEIMRTSQLNTRGPVVFGDNAGTVVISKIEVTYEATSLKEAGLAWSVKEFTAYMDQSNQYPTLTKLSPAVPDYSSDNEDVATINASTGEITLVGLGTARITAGVDAVGDFDWGEASYMLTVKRKGEENAIYNFTKFTIDDNKTGHMTDFPDIPYDGNKTVWWTTNPDQSYTSGAQFKPLTITKDKTSITFSWDGTEGGHGNLRATTSSKNNNLQLGGGTAMTIKTDGQESFLYEVVLDINPGISDANWTKTVEAIKTDENGVLKSDKNAKTTIWTPKDGEKTNEAYIDCVGGAYISSIDVSYCASGGASIIIPTVNNDPNAPVEYYNLQGVKINNPSNGMYIRRQGSQTTKIIIK